VLRIQLGSILSRSQREQILNLQKDHPDLYGDIPLTEDVNPEIVRRLSNDGITFSLTGENEQLQ